MQDEMDGRRNAMGMPKRKHSNWIRGCKGTTISSWTQCEGYMGSWDARDRWKCRRMRDQGAPRVHSRRLEGRVSSHGDATIG